MGQSKYGQESGLPPHQKWPATAKTSAAVTGFGVGVAAGLGGTTGLGVTVELGESAVVSVPMPAQPANTHRTRTAINVVGFRAGMGLLESSGGPGAGRLPSTLVTVLRQLVALDARNPSMRTLQGFEMQGTAAQLVSGPSVWRIVST
jgi:hypothetical protein